MKRNLLSVALCVSFAANLPAESFRQQETSQPVNIVAEWSLSDTNHGQLVGEGSFNAGILTLAGGYVTFGNETTLNNTGGVSFCLWLNPDKTDRIMRVLGKFQKENEKEFCVFIDADNRIWTFFSDNGTADKEHAIVRTTTIPVIENGEWQHLAVTWNAGLGVRVYVNGSAVETVSAQEPDLKTLYHGTAEFTLGAYDVGNGPVRNTFHGSIGKVILLQGALSAGDIREIWSMDEPFFAEKNNDRVSRTSSGRKNVFGHSAKEQTEPEISPNQNRTGCYFVDALQGDDSFDGAHISVVDRTAKKGPLKTINAALRRAKPRETINVAQGIYTEKVKICGVKVITNGRVEIR